MKLEYKQFEFAETLRDMDSVLLPEYDKLVPKNQFLSSSEIGADCAFAGVVAVCVRMKAYDNNKLEIIQKAYELIRHVMLDIFRDNADCIDVICMGRYFVGIFNTPVKTNIDGLIVTMSKLNAALSVLDIKLHKRFNMRVEGNCGCDYGELFRVQTSVNNNKKWSTWHGAALNMAILYAEKERQNDVNGTIISENVRENIKDDFAKFFTKYDSDLCGYWASLVDSVMFEWVKTNR